MFPYYWAHGVQIDNLVATRVATTKGYNNWIIGSTCNTSITQGYYSPIRTLEILLLLYGNHEFIHLAVCACHFLTINRDTTPFPSRFTVMRRFHLLRDPVGRLSKKYAS